MTALAAKLAAQMKKLRTQLFWAYLLLFTLFLAVALAAFALVRQLVTGQIGAGRLDVLRQIAERASTIKTSGITLSNLYFYELEEQGALEVEPGAGEDALTAYLDRQKAKYDEVFSQIGIDNEVLFTQPQGFCYDSGQAVSFEALGQQLWYRRLLQSLIANPEEEVQFSRTFRNDFAPAPGGARYQFAAGRRMEKADGSAGVLLVLLDEQLLEELYAPALGEGGEIYIYDQDGFIVSHSNKKMLGKQFVNVDNMRSMYGENRYSVIQKLGQSYLLSTYLDEDTGWTIVEEIPTDAIFGVLNQAYTILGGAALAGLAAALAVALYMSARISRPLTELSDAMDAFGSRDFAELSANTGTWEIDHLRQSFNHMAVEIFHLMDAVQERERQKRVLEMNFLRAQINPHFLYNMLFSIRCTVEIGKNRQAAQMITAFTDLLKSTLMVKKAAVPLEDEFESARKYLVVQKLRYGDKVHFELDLGPGTGRCQVPPLILQPLVENAIFHGLEAKPSADMVVVASALEGRELVLTVTDDGAGMDAETLERVRAKCRSTDLGDGSSIGLANVHNRIRLNYGAGYGVQLDSVPDIGTTVTIRMPAVWEKGEKSDESADC